LQFSSKWNSVKYGEIGQNFLLAEPLSLPRQSTTFLPGKDAIKHDINTM
jgi:hypothetical protein